MFDYKLRNKSNRLYRIWNGMKNRCNCEQARDYKNYGARGIKVEFDSFESFVDWSLENGYKENLTIDRINNNDNYRADNCRWTDIKTQANNKRSNDIFTYKNETHTLTEWAEIYGLQVTSLHKRIYVYGYSFEEAISMPCEKRERIITYKGKSQNLRQWSEELNIPYNALRSRLNNLHWTVAKAFETPYKSFYWIREGEKNV